MKKKLAILLILCLSLGLMFGCGGAGEEKAPAPDDKEVAADDSLTQIEDKGKFIVGLDDAFPPMGYREEGTNEIIGFDIDLAKEVASRLGVEVEFQPVIWDTIIEELNGGNIDVIWNGLTITPERQEKIIFSDPYLDNAQIVVVQKGSPLKTKADLAGKTVGLQGGSSAMNAVKADQATYDSLGEIVEFASNDEALLDLAAGRLDAVVVDNIVGRYYISKKADVYDVADEDFGDEEFGAGFRKGDVAFRDKVQEALDEMKADGTSAKISEKWFGADIVK
ncbi:MAG: amino acid ABC transporter substrate-binding protein [Syntrophomonadaceae bacterium]|jgi:polar amino acid transport system substrate-binding protein|nr:amino acid ABC transporter substrate-binding protein [Syntrophomonadaceae bacterium]